VEDMLEIAQIEGVRLVACHMTLEMMKMDPSELIEGGPDDPVIGGFRWCRLAFVVRHTNYPFGLTNYTVNLSLLFPVATRFFRLFVDKYAQPAYWSIEGRFGATIQYRKIRKRAVDSASILLMSHNSQIIDESAPYSNSGSLTYRNSRTCQVRPAIFAVYSESATAFSRSRRHPGSSASPRSWSRARCRRRPFAV